MAGIILKPVLKKILGETLENKFGQKDPYFETVPATRIDGKPAKKPKRVRKANPPGLSEHDAMVLTKVKRRAYRLDSCLFSCFGVRFGWGSAIGLVPVAGDAADALLALMVVRTCNQVEGGLPFGLKLKMYFWVLIDLIVGLVPFIGDLFDAILRANTRNAVLLEEHLREKGQKNLRKNGLPIPDVDPSEADAFDRFSEAPASEYVSRQPSRREPMSSARRDRERDRERRHRSRTPTRPAEARVRDEPRSGGGGGWFGFGRSRTADPEMGLPDDDPPPRRKPSRRH
jgi:hypothetical protein